MTANVTLKNQFLLAMPNQVGTYFADTATYICEHNEDGAMGIVVNRPSELSLVELLAQMGLETTRVAPDVQILEGGPVASERGFVLHSDDGNFATSLALDDGLMLSTAQEMLEAIARGEGPRDFLVALGYAGWGSGQLEGEIKDNAWLNCPGSKEVLFNTPFGERVDKAAAGLGIDFRLMSGHAGHS